MLRMHIMRLGNACSSKLGGRCARRCSPKYKQGMTYDEAVAALQRRTLFVARNAPPQAAETADAVYVFEFKLDANGIAEDALWQIDDKGYLVPYTVTKKADGSPKKLLKIGVAFDAEKRTIGEWIVK